MINVLHICLAFLLCILQVKSQSPDSTWEDYNGTIPENAFLASDDPNNPVYVGMAKVGRDNCTGSLLPGANEMAVECNGKMNKVKEGLKILTVTDPKKFKWFPAPRKDRFWADIGSVGKAVTCGSSVYRQSSTLVGRTITDDDGTLEVGHINNPVFYLVHKNTKRQKTAGYEILINVNKPVPPPPQSEEYAWEDYDGTIPEKAFSSSDDPNNPVYVGLALVYADYCPGTLLPEATEITVECYGVYTVKEGLKILTVNDPKTFKWFPAPRKDRFWKDIGSVGEAVTSGTSVTRKTTTLVGRTIVGNDGTPVVGHINGLAFHSVHNNSQSQKSSGYEILINVKKPVPPPPQSEEYTWEDYDGTIPEKAFSSSDDPNNPVYVGLGLVYADYCPGTLLPGATEITVECYGVYTVKEGLKILTVNDPKTFKWFPDPRKGRFWEDVGSVGKAVTSGTSVTRKTTTLVGRTIAGNDGTPVVGHINGLAFHSVHNNSQSEKSSGYEILIIVKKSVPPPPQSQEYTWEDYDGTIPEKAFSSSNDSNNPVYVGLALIYTDYCPGTLLPGATEITVECYGVYTVEKDLKILTVNDPERFRWFPAPSKDNFWDEVKSMGAVVTSGKNLARQGTSTLVGRRITDDNLIVGHINNADFYFIHNNTAKQTSSGYDILIIVKEAAPALPQNKEQSASEEPTALNSTEPIVDTNVYLKAEADPEAAEPTDDVCDDLKVETDAQAAPEEAPADVQTVKSPSAPEAPPAPKEPSGSNEPGALNPSEPTVETKMDLKVEADVPAVPKEPSTPKVPSASEGPAALNLGQKTVDTNADLKAEADAQVATKEPSTPKTQSASKDLPDLNPSEPTVDTNVDLEIEADVQTDVKSPSAPEAPPALKEPGALNPIEPTVDTKMDLKVEADAPAVSKEPSTPKAPSASKGSAVLNVGQPPVGTNMDLKVEAEPQAAPEATVASRAPSYPNSWSNNYWYEYGIKSATNPGYSPTAPATPNPPAAPKAGAYVNAYQFGG